MKKLLSGFVHRTLGVLVALLIATNTLHAQVAPSIEWEKCLGGTYGEYTYSIQPTTDGGFIVAGVNDSYDGDVVGNNGGADYWIVKLDSAGYVEWQQSLGGSGDDVAQSIQNITDGGFIIAGYSNSNDSDVSGNHGYYDYWIVKLNEDGSLVWQKSLGGSQNDLAYSVQQTTGGGYIILGWSLSNDGDVSGNHGSIDYWIVQLDASGNLVWQKCLGGSGEDGARSIQQTTDGGFIVAGNSASNDGDVSGNHGQGDYWIVKLDIAGNLVWQKSLGGSGGDGATSIQQAIDGGFIVAGTSGSNDGDVSGNYGNLDYWIVRLDSLGNIGWQKFLGGSNIDFARSVQQTTGGGFIIAGSSASNDGNISQNQGWGDYWIVKLDSAGNLLWQKSFGGTEDDIAYSIQQTSDGGFIIGGSTSSNDGDVSGNHGSIDCWIVKLSNDATTGISSPLTNSIFLHPNPVQDLLPITLATQAANATIRVYDLQGRIVALPITFTNTQAQLNTTSLPDGFYTLQITNNKTGASEVGKFVKQQ